MVNSQESVDLQGLLGLLHVSSSTEHETEKENAKSGKTRTTTTATATAAKPRAEDELRGWTTRSNESRRKGGHERSEEYREKGNDLYRIGAYEGAADFYTRAINADPRNEKAYGNRCAAYTLMKLYRKALNDANYGLSLSPSWAKLQSRKAVAHFYLKEYDESVQAYQAALGLDPGNEEYRKGLEQAKRLGGSAQNLERRRKDQQEREKREKENAAAAAAGRRKQQNYDYSSRENEAPMRYGSPTVEEVLRQRGRKEQMRMEQYERDLIEYKKIRRECLAKWRASTGLVNEKPEEDRGRSVRVDIFGFLRGKCVKSGCNAWYRDIDAVHNAWGNEEAITCAVCGYSNGEHEDCGQYPLREPLKPRSMGTSFQDELKIPGIHRAN